MFTTASHQTHQRFDLCGEPLKCIGINFVHFIIAINARTPFHGKENLVFKNRSRHRRLPSTAYNQLCKHRKYRCFWVLKEIFHFEIIPW